VTERARSGAFSLRVRGASHVLKGRYCTMAGDNQLMASGGDAGLGGADERESFCVLRA